MKSCKVIFIGTVFFASTFFVSARDTALHYKFSEGQTNVYAVEIVVRSENGSETNSGNVILSTKKVTTNSVTLVCRGTFKSEARRAFMRPGMYSGFYPGGISRTDTVFPYNCEITLDFQGNEIRDGGDYVMTIPLGKLVQALFIPLPARTGNSEWQDTVIVLDDPFWLGPADNFLNVRQNGQALSASMNYYSMDGQRNSITTLAASRETKSQWKDSTAHIAELHLQSQLQSPVQIDGEPCLVTSSETDAAFDRDLGLMTRIAIQADVNSQSETSSRHAKVTFKSRLLAGDELAAALVSSPPPVISRVPTPPKILSGAELDKFVSDLKSPDLEVRRSAMRQSYGKDIDSPSAEVLDEVDALAFDSDTITRMAAINLISNHATTNEVPLLLKFLKGSDWSSKQSAIKALGRLKDPRAVEPLCDILARNGNMMSQEVVMALTNIGTPAEKAVLGLLNERNAETQRLACTILQQIGTNESLDTLQRLVASDDQSASQAAADAIRAIKQRQ